MSVAELLKKTRVEVSPETYFVISLKDFEWHKLLENPELSPRMTAPFMIFKDKWEITLVIDETDFQTCRHAIRDAKVEGGFRLVSFDMPMDFFVVGYFAEITKILAQANIPILALSAFSRDHLLIKQENLAKTLKVLGEYVEELC
ncbi:MAG: ACT domain-containing protein [Pyrinomonadaceae bacterium]|nr:ACT domain-containing protein [Pyrinomonadaceae bacterium]